MAHGTASRLSCTMDSALHAECLPAFYHPHLIDIDMVFMLLIGSITLLIVIFTCNVAEFITCCLFTVIYIMSREK